MANKHYQLIILGSGPAGCTAAIYAARANLDFAMIVGLEQGGQLTKTDKVDNWPGEPEGITGAALMQKMMEQVERFTTNVISDSITEVDFSKPPFVLKGDAGEYSCDVLIIATGASPRFLGLSSEQEYFGRGVSTCAVCDGFFYRNKDVVIVGGGNTTAGEALYLSEIAASVTIVHRRDAMRAEPILIEKIKNSPNIKLEMNKIVEEILGDDQGVTGIKIQDVATKESKELKSHGVFIAIGHKPNSDIFAGQLEMESGYIKTGYKFATDTSVPGVFAAGDVVAGSHKQAVIAAGSGSAAAIDVKAFLDQADN